MIIKNLKTSKCLTAQDTIDLWTIYNLLESGDYLGMYTTRKVKGESKGSSSEKRAIFLWIKLEKFDIDPKSGIVRASGKNKTMSPFINVGQYHTFELDVGKEFFLSKYWNFYTKDLLSKANDPSVKRQFIFVLIEGSGTCNIYSATIGTVRLLTQISYPIPRRQRIGNYEKSMKAFYAEVENCLRPKLSAQISCLVLAGPGNAKDTFYNRLFSNMKQDAVLSSLHPNTVVVSTSSAQKLGLGEVIKSPELKAAHLYIGEHQKLCDLFYDTLKQDPDMVTTGYKECKYAIEQGAMKVLLVTETITRRPDIRRSVLKMLQTVRKNGSGHAEVIPEQHIAGEQINQMGGMVGILSFKIDSEELIESGGWASPEAQTPEPNRARGSDDEELVFDFNSGPPKS